MKKICVVMSVVLSTYVCARVDLGFLGLPSYETSAKEAVSKFNFARNGELAYVFGGQEVSSPLARPSQFRESLSLWDAAGDLNTSRGTLQVLWHRTGASDPAAGWPVIQHAPTMGELMLMYPVMPD